MNLIEKVARALKPYIFDLFDTNECIDAAQAAISAMPSIKWQKIETLPEEYKNSKTQFLVWSIASKQAVIGVYGIHSKEFGFHDKNSHWAEINVPEEE